VVYSSRGFPTGIFNPDRPVVDQLQVEIIRLTRNEPRQRAFWEPYLQRVEAVIAQELALPDLKPLDPRARELRTQIDAIYDEALRANAAAIGKTYKPMPAMPSAGIYQVVFKSDSGQKSIYAMPYLTYLLRQADTQKRPVKLIEYTSYPTNQEIRLSGKYVYTLAGQPANVDTFTVNNDGTISVR
jgi:hypothetical protein